MSHPDIIFPARSQPDASIESSGAPVVGDANAQSRRTRASAASPDVFPPGQIPSALQPFYYSVYAGSGFIASIRPVNPEYPAISMFYLEHVPPPRTAHHVIRHICSRENIDFQHGMKLYARPGESVYRQAPELVTYKMMGEIPMACKVGRVLPQGFGLKAPLGTEGDPLRLLLSNKEDQGGRWHVARRSAVGLSFAGVAGNAEMRAKIQRNMEMAPSSAVTNSQNNRAPANTRPVHYRLYWGADGYAPLPSIRPLFTADPSFSSTATVHVPPPGNGGNYINHIASLEGFHPSRLRLYEHDSSQILLDKQVPLLPDGSRPANLPLLITVDLPRAADGGPDRSVGLNHVMLQPLLDACISGGLCTLTYLLASLILSKGAMDSINLPWLAAKPFIVFELSRRRQPFLTKLRDVLLADIGWAFNIYCVRKILGPASAPELPLITEVKQVFVPKPVPATRSWLFF